VQLITLDFETYYAADYSLRKMPTALYLRDERFKAHGTGIKINNGPAKWVTAKKLPYLFDRIPWHNTALAGHNLHFDAAILNWHYGHVPKLHIDTLALSRALYGQHLQRHGLEWVSKEVTGEGKLEGLAQTMGMYDLSESIERSLAYYCIGDVEKTYAVLKRLLPLFPRNELYIMDWVTRQFTQPRLMMDDALLADYLEEVKQLKVDALANAGLEDRKMLMSNPQYAAALELLGVTPPVKINAKGKVTFAFAKTDEEHKALLEHEDPKVQALVAARLEVKSTIEETRAASYLAVAPTGAWPVDYKYAGAMNTHRLSGANGGGGNPANLKRGGTLRRAIHAVPGKRLLVADLAQIECRIVLWLGAAMPAATGAEREALEVMAAGGDLYSHFGTIMYGYPINKHDHPIERQIAKSAVLGLGFGMGPGRFLDYCKSMGIKIEPVMAESAVALYRNTYKGVKQLWAKVDKGLKNAVQFGADAANEIWIVPNTRLCHEPLNQHVAIASPSGLMLKYPELNWDAEGQGTYRDGASFVNMFGGKAVENIVQHLARNILMDSLVKIDPVYPVVLSTYDELVCEIDDNEDSIRIATAFVKKIMTAPHPLFPGLPLGVGMGTAVRYGDAEH
jgi:DNA polymerase